MTDYLALYRNYLTTEKRMSANTVSSYMRDLGQYQDWLQQKKTDIKKAKNTLLQEYIKRLEQLGKSPATTSRFLASSKSFYAYMLAKGYIKTNPSSWLTSPYGRTPSVVSIFSVSASVLNGVPYLYFLIISLSPDVYNIIRMLHMGSE